MAEAHANLQNPRGRELLNLARRIYFEGTREEKARMPHPTAPPLAFVEWAKQEARCGIQNRSERWRCLAGLMPTWIPPESEEVDPLPYLSPAPAMD